MPCKRDTCPPGSCVPFFTWHTQKPEKSLLKSLLLKILPPLHSEKKNRAEPQSQLLLGEKNPSKCLGCNCSNYLPPLYVSVAIWVEQKCDRTHTTSREKGKESNRSSPLHPGPKNLKTCSTITVSCNPHRAFEPDFSWCRLNSTDPRTVIILPDKLLPRYSHPAPLEFA